MNLINFFDKGVERHPDRLFLLDTCESVTYRQAQARSRCIASALRREGFGPHTRVAVCSENSVRACQSVIGLLRAGCVWVTVPAGSTDDVSRALTNTETEVLLFSSSFEDKIEAIVAACPSLKVALCIDGGDDAERSLDRVLATASMRFDDVAEEPEAIATLFSSGGTTGTPKGVVMTNRAWELLVASSTINVGHGEAVKLMVTPIGHTAGAVMFLADLATSPTYVLLDRFDPERVLTAIERHRVTSLFLPPTAINILLTHPSVRRYDYSSLKYLVYGGAPIAPARVTEAMEVFGPVMATGFAQTETGGPVTFMSPTDHARALEDNRVERFASCGKETLFARAEIMDDEGQMVPIGSEGELVVRSNHLMAGYFAGAATRPILPLEPGGWYRTGDIAFKDDEGFFYLRDRKREMIISRGYNIFPADIEKVIEGEAGVRACAVVGVPDDEMGERVVAVVESVPGRCIDSNHLLDVCRRRLAPQLVPVAIETWPSLPRSSAGKVVRRQVRDVFWKGRARKI